MGNGFQLYIKEEKGMIIYMLQVQLFWSQMRLSVHPPTRKISYALAADLEIQWRISEVTKHLLATINTN